MNQVGIYARNAGVEEVCLFRETDRESARERSREKDKRTEAERHRQRERESESETETECYNKLQVGIYARNAGVEEVCLFIETDRESARERSRETDKQTEAERHRQIERERQNQRQRQSTTRNARWGSTRATPASRRSVYS